LEFGCIILWRHTDGNYVIGNLCQNGNMSLPYLFRLAP
jgi:hypothetical protein